MKLDQVLTIREPESAQSRATCSAGEATSAHRARAVEPASDGVPLLGRRAVVHLVAGGHRLGQGDADLGFAGGDDAGARATERGGVAQMGAAHEDAQIGVEEARLPDDLGGVLDIRAQDQAAGRRDAGFVEGSRSQDVAVQRRRDPRRAAGARCRG